MSKRPAIDLIITNRRSVETGLAMRRPYILISIRDPDKRPVRIRPERLCRAMLELAFHDAEPVVGFTPAQSITSMNEDHARSIWQFVREHEGNYPAIVVHCEQGVSRSPAVAAALAEGLGVDGRRFWREYQPNRYVYQSILAAAAITGH